MWFIITVFQISFLKILFWLIFHLFCSFEDLALAEQTSLLQTNGQKLIGYLWALYCEPTDLKIFTQNLFQYGQTHPDDLGVERVLSALGSLDLENKSFNYGYKIVYSTPWAPNADIEERHFKLTQIISQLSRSADKKTLDSLILVLSSMILLLNPDDTDMPNASKEKVSNIQMKYISLLHRYLKAKYPKKANSKLAGALMLIQMAKELYDLHAQRLPF